MATSASSRMRECGTLSTEDAMRGIRDILAPESPLIMELSMPQLFPIAAITDEFSPDIEVAVRSMQEIGMTGAELRMVFGKNIMDLTDEELDRAIAICRGAGQEIISIASPLLKCVLPNAPDADPRFQHDIFASKHTFQDQPRLTERAFQIAEKTGAKIIRVFSYWRTVRPEECFDRIVTALRGLAEKAA